MQYDFDRIIERRHTACHRYDNDPTGKRICLGIADMDFPVAPPIIEAMERRMSHPIFAYTLDEDRRYEAVIHWQQSRFGFTPEKSDICWVPSVMGGISMLLRALTKPGDGVIVQPPVYTPFSSVIKQNGRTVVENPLLYSEETGWSADLDGLEDAFCRSGAKVLLVCSPHNPVGLCYSKETLTKMVEICHRHGAYLISDETHCDFYYHGNVHTPIFLAGPLAASNCVLFTSTSKSFNLSGMNQAYAIIPNEELRNGLKQELQFSGYANNIFSFEAMIAAYTQCGPWMDALCTYLGESMEEACRFINEEIPGWSIQQPQATFFLWPKLDRPAEELMPYILDEALVELRNGAQYGPLPGHQNLRLCVGTPKAVLMEALNRIADVMKRHR